MTVNHSFFCKATDIASISLDIKGGYMGIGNFVMNKPGCWQYFELPNMVFEQVKERTKRPWWMQAMTFGIPSKDVLAALKEHYELPCNLVAAHYLNDSGHYRIQGIEPELTVQQNYVSSKILMPKMILPKNFDSNFPMQGRFESGAEMLSSFCFLSKKQFESM